MLSKLFEECVKERGYLKTVTGHEDINTTERYLDAEMVALQENTL